MIKAILLFYVFKFAPRIIDNHSFVFWRKAVIKLNEERRVSRNKFYLWKLGRLYVRDRYCIPNTEYFTYSTKHPFCWRK